MTDASSAGGTAIAAAGATRAGDRRLILAAWVATLLLSRLPEIVLREAFSIETPWMGASLIGMAVVLVVVASIWSATRCSVPTSW